MRTAAVVVDYDVGGPLVDCLVSLHQEGVERVVVVENGDRRAAAARLDRAGLRVPLVAPGRNVGYGAGVNRGVSALGPPGGDADYVLVLNADVTLHPGALGALVSALDADPTVALAGPRIVDPQGTPYPSARRFPSFVDAAGHALLGLIRPDNSFSRRYHDGVGAQGGEISARPAVDWISGSCFLARRQAFEELGGFDESYFMYAEDLDLCWRAGLAGWQVVQAPDATITHRQGASTDRHPYRMLVEHHRSAWRFACRSTAGWRRALLPAAAVLLAARLATNVTIRKTRGSAPR